MVRKRLDKINKKIIKEIPKGKLLMEQVTVMFWNLWGQFGFRPKSKHTKKYKTYEFFWTEKARFDFYDIPDHKKIISKLKKNNLLSDWTLNCEPADLMTNQKKENEKKKN